VPAPVLAGPASLGDTARYGVRILGVGYAPSRVSLMFSTAAYLTIVSVTPERIDALVPTAEHDSKIVEAGAMTIALGVDTPGPNAGGRGGDAGGDEGSAAARMEQSACAARVRARNAARAKQSRRQVGTDSKGNPIYVEDPPPEIDEDRACPLPGVNGGKPLATAPRSRRYLLVFASDTPVSNQNLIDLAVTEGDPRSMAMAIGTKLFSIRGGTWSVTVAPW
jgi:hypothetical protein